jgi:hypothetical protein
MGSGHVFYQFYEIYVQNNGSWGSWGMAHSSCLARYISRLWLLNLQFVPSCFVILLIWWWYFVNISHYFSIVGRGTSHDIPILFMAHPHRCRLLLQAADGNLSSNSLSSLPLPPWAPWVKWMPIKSQIWIEMHYKSLLVWSMFAYSCITYWHQIKSKPAQQ